MDFFVGSNYLACAGIKKIEIIFVRVAGEVVCKVIEVREIKWGYQ